VPLTERQRNADGPLRRWMDAGLPDLSSAARDRHHVEEHASALAG
jgi:hypothetical protein